MRNFLVNLLEYLNFGDLVKLSSVLKRNTQFTIHHSQFTIRNDGTCVYTEFAVISDCSFNDFYSHSMISFLFIACQFISFHESNNFIKISTKSTKIQYQNTFLPLIQVYQSSSLNRLIIKIKK